MNSSPGGAVTHIVMWRLHAPTEDLTHTQATTLLKDALYGMVGEIPGLLQLEVGIDTRRRANSYDVALTTRFENAAALETYHDHPAHVAIKPLVSRLAANSVVVDYPS